MPLSEFTALLPTPTAAILTPGPNAPLSPALAAHHGLPGTLRCARPVT